MGAKRGLLASAAVLAAALAGCAGGPQAGQTPTAGASPSPSADASGPLSCDDLVSGELVAAALVGADGDPVDPVPAVNGTDAFTGVLLEGVGGFACSWRVGSGMPEYQAPSDWAYLRLDVLPDAAGDWMPLQLGDAPSPDTREVAGVEASVAAGDAGWFLSAPVGEDWAVASITAAGLAGTGSRFEGIDAERMLDRLADVAEAAFTTLGTATPDRLERPAVELRATDAACTGPLDRDGIVDAAQLRAGTTVEYLVTDATAEPLRDFAAAVHAAARTFDCELRVDGGTVVTVTAAPGFGPLMDAFRAPDADVALDGLPLDGAPAGVEASAVVERPAEDPAAVAVVAVGDALYQVRGERVEEVARAIVAQSE